MGLVAPSFFLPRICSVAEAEGGPSLSAHPPPLSLLLQHCLDRDPFPPLSDFRSLDRRGATLKAADRGQQTCKLLPSLPTNPNLPPPPYRDDRIRMYRVILRGQYKFVEGSIIRLRLQYP